METNDTSLDIWGEPTENEEDIFNEEDFKNAEEDTTQDAENESKESTEEQDETKSSEDVKPEEKQSLETYVIKYKDKEYSLSRDDLIMKAQKGMDYDRIRQERDDFRSSLDDIAELAKEAHMPIKEYLAEVKKNIENQKIETIAEKLIENGTDENTAREMARLQFERDRATKELEGIRNANDIQEKQQSEIDNAIQNDMQRLEKIIGKPVTDELLNSLEKYFKEGMTIVEAYMQKTIDEQNLKLQTQEQNEKNKQRSTGSVKTQKAINQDDDIISALMDA